MTAGRAHIVFSPVAAAPPIPEPASCASSSAKRAVDIAVAALALLVFAPVFAVIAIAIRLSSPGPVLFRQPRIGLGGRPFTVLKFRTMRAGASDASHREFVSTQVSSTRDARTDSGVFKLVNDDRVTRVGRFLRRTSLDELPQFWNVLRGEMSVVGPRPPLEYEIALYEAWQLERLTARPGITGLWQVMGRNRLTYHQMCKLDVRYVRQWSLIGDVVIMLKTPWVMLTNSGKAA